jgi:N-acetylglucosaminyl-diphospho-decaprenol L-rhamnosyltransferase
MHRAMDDPRVSVIVAAWNSEAVIGACLDSVERQRVEGGFETIVVDDASTDGTADVLRRYERRVTVISNARNASYSGANNQAARAARGRVLVFLNADTELLAPDVVERLARAVEQPGVGLAGPMLVNPDGTLQPSCAAHPTVLRALVVGAGLHRLLPDAARARIAPERWSHARAIDADWVMGAALAVRAEAFRDLGGFWDFLYAEEQDLAYRARRRGLRVRFEPGARVMHVGNHAFSQRMSDAQRAARVAAAELAFLRAHYGRSRAAAIRTVTGAAYLTRALAHALLGRGARAAVYRSLARVYVRGPSAGSS